MLAITQSAAGDASTLALTELAEPEPGPGEVLIEVAFAGVNRPDILQRQGLYPPPKDASPILGLEVSGVVSAVGAGVSSQWLGQAVAALCNGGGYAQKAVVPEGQLLPIHGDALSLEAAAALPEGLFTVWHNVIERGQLEAEHCVLIHGGSGGIGHLAIQVARWRGATIVATASSADKAEFCQSLGAHRVLRYDELDFVEAFRTDPSLRAPDVILDMVGGAYIAKHIQIANADARIVQIAFQQGSRVEVDLMRLMLKRLTLTGSTLRARSLEVKAAMRDAIVEQLWSTCLEGARAALPIVPVVDRVFPLAEAGGAHAALESGEVRGKILLSCQ